GRPRRRAADQGLRSPGVPRQRQGHRHRLARRGARRSEGAGQLPRRGGMSIVLDTGDFTVAAGEIVALLGANGAGKTTLMETILGFRTSRTIRLFSQDVTSLPVERRVALGVGYVPERRRLFASLTV